MGAHKSSNGGKENFLLIDYGVRENSLLFFALGCKNKNIFY
jgi:hypothetical protein